MTRRSAGLLMYRRKGGSTEVLLVHPGGPFWAKKDAGAWSIPKGEYDSATEDALAAAKREFTEETGFPSGDIHHSLGEAKPQGGKLVTAWAFEGDCDPNALVSNTFELEWPPRSGRLVRYPEVDRAEWFATEEARRRINPAQCVFIERLENLR
ncbi:NUDIX domain-containing protein [Variovorax sp. Sphag1AA]|uniref:NUDIX domain-containing protein n=1 Tax=Variovorax sp. Sphag1AA TaxID=2587027 RepID=UPI00161A0DFD|nr:NUDIX domain-containing protein [Variovorax sp. Sphag1AA]MBB3176831.1 putative NUDIX family NTP pyrophosphohydrolase [Variovorax sp. Sphag1AA]